MFMFTPVVLYLVFGLIGFLLGFSFSFYMRMELMVPFTVFSDDDYFNVMVTSHAAVMVFLALMPLANAFFNFVVLMFLEVSSKLYYSSLSLLLFLLGYLLVVFSLLTKGSFGYGWTLYPPLSIVDISIATDILLLGIIFLSVSSFLSSIDSIFLILLQFQIFGIFLPVALWSYLICFLMIVLSIPVFILALMFLLFDRQFSLGVYTVSYGGDPVLYQSLFWFFGHPEVYILILPVFGLVSLSLSRLKGGLYGSIGMVFSLICILFLGMIVWGHHMFTVGLSLDFRSYFMGASMAISIPTGVKVFNWLTTLYSFKGPMFSLSQSWALLFLLVFVSGGVSGVILGNSFLDIVLHDSYFVVGHFHLVLGVSALLGYSSGLMYLLEAMSFYGYINLRSLRFNVLISYWLTFFMTSLFLSFHWLGVWYMPRRISCYPEKYFSVITTSTLCFWLSYQGFLLFVSELIISFSW